MFAGDICRQVSANRAFVTDENDVDLSVGARRFQSAQHHLARRVIAAHRINGDSHKKRW
jgi:hypothetical protein